MHIFLPTRTLRPGDVRLISTRIPWARHLTGALLAAVASLALAAPALAASELFVRGAGYGHGVGMSQYGAYGYALHARDYRYILAHYYTGTSLGTVDPRRVVTVLLATGDAAFAGATRAGGKRLRPTLTYHVRAASNGRLRLIGPSGKVVGSFASPLTATGRGTLSVPGLGAYRGALEFRPAGARRVETINAVGLDDYTRGVVAAEMPSAWSMQALEAQAVAARTYAITTDAGGSAFDQYSDTRSQMYGGAGAETPRSNVAVAATQGQVVTYHGRPVVTYFSSSSGGYTENNENVFAGTTPAPWLRGVPDPYDGAAGNPNHRWLVALTGTRAAAKLAAFVEGGLLGVRVLRHGVSPRITSAAVVATRGTRSVAGADLEQALGLRSTWATFTTITTVASRYVSHVPSAGAGVADLVMPLPLVAAVLAHVASVPELGGTVFPAPAGAPIAVQERRGGTWRTVKHTTLSKGGGYTAAPAHHGVYRIVYDGLDGPPVAL